MTTDITELAQSLKAAAPNVTSGPWVVKDYFWLTPESEVFSGEFVECHNGPDAQYLKLLSPENILALVEALEKAQRANGHLREQSAEWERKAISNFEDCAEMSARIKDLESQRKLAFTASNRWADKFREAEKRYADMDIESAVKDASILELKQQYQRLLESRTVTVEPFRSFVTDADLAALHRFAECCDDPESGGHDLEKEQVRRLEEIGALRRTGRVHWITGFGDVLISITSGSSGRMNDV